MNLYHILTKVALLFSCKRTSDIKDKGYLLSKLRYFSRKIIGRIRFVNFDLFNVF